MGPQSNRASGLIHRNIDIDVAQSCPTLCNPMDCSLLGSSIHGIFQARVLEWVAISFSRRSSWPRDRTRVSRIVGRHKPSEPPGKEGASSLSLHTQSLRKDYLSTQWEGAVYKPGRESLNWPCWHPDLRLLAFRTVRKFLLFKLPSLWYFIMVAWAGWDIPFSFFSVNVYYLPTK